MESDGDDAPDTLFEIIGPSKSRLAVMRAWDRSRQPGRSVDQRVEAVIEALLMEPEVVELPPAPQAQTPERPHKRRRVQSPGDDDVVVVGEKQGRDVIELDASSPRPPMAGPSAPPRPEIIPGPPPLSPTSERVAQIEVFFPDIDTAHARALLTSPSYAELDTPVDAIVSHLFDANGKYPKRPEPSKKRKRGDSEAPEKRKDEKYYMDWRAREVLPFPYGQQCLETLMADFPNCPKPWIVNTMARVRSFYAPAFVELEKDSLRVPPPFKVLKGSGRKDKGRSFLTSTSPDFEAERLWFIGSRAAAKAEKDAAEAQRRQDEEEEKAGLFLECQCCYCDSPFRLMAQCTEAHLFCAECVRKQAELLIGQRRIDIVCMTDECGQPFPDSELQRVLPRTSMDLLERNRTEKYVELAAMDGFARCPFCDFGMVIDNPDEKLFRCAGADCGKVTCRSCKRIEHLPLSCKEYEETELKQKGMHAVAEAMSAALIKKCPKCSQPYVKEGGCNKMTCSFCRTLSCFVCGKIVQGYQHFANSQAYVPPGTADPNATCVLFDTNEAQKIHDQVEAARRAAAAEVQLQDADADRLAAARPPPGPQLPGYANPLVGAQAIPGYNRAAGVQALAGFDFALPAGAAGAQHRYNAQQPLPYVPPARRGRGRGRGRRGAW